MGEVTTLVVAAAAAATHPAGRARGGTRAPLDGTMLAYHRGTLALLLARSARHSEGIAVAEEALRFMDAKNPTPHWDAEKFRMTLGELQRASGQPGAALGTWNRVLERVRTLPDYEHSSRYAALLKSRALSKYDLGRSGEATADMTRSLALYEASLPSHPGTLNARVLMAWLFAAANPANVSAEAKFNEAARAYATALPPNHLSHIQLALLRADLHRKGSPKISRVPSG